MNHTDVCRLLHQIEKDYNVVILFACEAGSRSQGLWTDKSDHDIKFIYVRPTRSYLGLGARDDVIEKPYRDKLPNVEFVGWDVQKALDLATKSNAQLVEWLANTHVYHELHSFSGPLYDIMLSGYSARTVMYNSYGLAMKNWAVRRDSIKFTVKTLTMVVRALLITQWMHNNQHALPPWEFEPLLDACFDRTNPLYRDLIHLYQTRRSGVDTVVEEFTQVIKWVGDTLPLSKNWCDQAPNNLPNIMQLEKLCLQMTLDSGRLF